MLLIIVAKGLVVKCSEIILLLIIYCHQTKVIHIFVTCDFYGFHDELNRQAKLELFLII
jgi:hypothetical protein